MMLEDRMMRVLSGITIWQWKELHFELMGESRQPVNCGREFIKSPGISQVSGMQQDVLRPSRDVVSMACIGAPSDKFVERSLKALAVTI